MPVISQRMRPSKLRWAATTTMKIGEALALGAVKGDLTHCCETLTKRGEGGSSGSGGRRIAYFMRAQMFSDSPSKFKAYALAKLRVFCFS